MAESYSAPEEPAPAAGGTPAAGLAVVSPDDARAAGLAALLGTLLPRVRVARLDARALARSPEARAVVVDAAHDGMATARRLRAIGYEQVVVLAAHGEMDEGVREEAARLGVVACPEGDELGACVAAALDAALGDAALGETLRRTRRLLAAGGVALHLQHAVNNPLAALLAEAQLLEMEPLNDEQRAAVGRIVELCRRVNALVRELDGISRPRRG